MLTGIVMRRKLFSLCSVLSLLLCAAVCVLWVRGYFVTDEWIAGYVRPVGAIVSQRQLRTRSGYGGCEFSYDHYRLIKIEAFRPDDGFNFSHFWGNVVSAGSAAEQLGFSASSVSQPFQGAFASGTEDSVAIRLPCWFLLALFAATPLAYWRKRLLAKRKRLWRSAGSCPACGYDLRASPGRCPEGGHEPPTAAAA